MNTENTRPQLNSLQKFDFAKTAVMAGNMTTGEAIALKPIVENLGLDWSSQLKRLKREDPNGQLWSSQNYYAEDGKNREMICMNPVNFQNWLWNFPKSDNLKTELLEEYKKGLVVHLLMMLKVSLEEVRRLRMVEEKYEQSKQDISLLIDKQDEKNALSNKIKELTKQEKDIRLRIEMRFQGFNTNQLTAFD